MTFLILKSATMGSGTGCGLGEKLLASFLEQLVKSETRVDAVACLNGGVFLTTQDGPALGSLRALEARGARVIDPC
jgi:hypothetical protein